MARRARGKKPAEHLATLSRMAGQVDPDSELEEARRVKMKRLISELINEFSAEVAK